MSVIVSGENNLSLKIQEAIDLRNQDKFACALEKLEHLQKEFPNNPDVNYHLGWTYDAQDQPHAAIPYYKKALELNLKEDLLGCYIALGSSLRAIGQYIESRKVFEEGLSLFPRSRPLQVFLSMTFYNLNKPKQAMEILLNQLVETTSDDELKSYQGAFSGYADDLDARY